MVTEDLVVRGLIWLSLVCFVAAHAAFRDRPVEQGRRWPLTVYWAGAGLAFVHYLAAFHWHYDWSHSQAVLATAGQTAEAFGLDWGGGVWVNYLFLAAWGVDASGYTLHRPIPPGAWRWMLRAFYLTIIVNGAIVFAAAPMRPFGALLVAGLVWSWRPEARLVGPR
ncbi:MAG: hypothetical protein FJW23_12835 [Acidimicrobiia bacterium]|nr:hypothetical protein [Acidimicrobiia bacterium]